MKSQNLFLIVLFLSWSLGAAASPSCLGDVLHEDEKEIPDWANVDCSQEPTHVRRIDINGDGTPDFVVSTHRRTIVLLRRDKKIEMFAHIDFSSRTEDFCPIRSGNMCIPEITLIPSILQSGYDVVVRSWQGCGLIRGSNSPWRFDRYPWRSERFDCNKYDNRAYLLAQVECVASEGQWGAMNWGHWGGCYHSAKDVGKPCRSSSECEKMCIYEGDAVTNSGSVTGTCSQYRSCRTEVNNGKLGPYICVD